MDFASREDVSFTEAREQLRRAAFATITWLTYDILLSLGDELQCMWHPHMSWVMWLYVFVRYPPILHCLAVLFLKGAISHTPMACRGWIIYELVFVEVLTLVVEVILVIRIYILYNQRRWIVCLILSAFITEVVGMVVILSVVIPAQTITSGCLLESSPNIFLAYWLTALAFESFLFALTLVKYLQHIRGEHSHCSVLRLFFRDGSWAFAMIFTVMVLNALLYKLEIGPLAGMGYLWAVAVLSFSGSHILLNMRKLRVSPEAASDPDVFTTLRFPTFEYRSGSRPSSDPWHPSTDIAAER